MDGYKGRINNSLDKLIPITVLSAAIGFLSIYISNESDNNRNANNDMNQRPNTEAILTEEIKLYKNNFSKNIPGDKNKHNGSNGNYLYDSYYGKRII